MTTPTAASAPLGATRHDLTGPAIPEGMVRITRDGRHRFIWPVHLGGWQSLGWQLQPAADLPAPEPLLPELEPELDPDLAMAPDPEAEMAELDVQTSPAVEESDPSSATDLVEPEPRQPELEPELDPDPEEEADQELEPGFESEVTEPMSLDAGTELQSAPLGTDFQAMTKAQILEHCSSVYGVDLDGSQTKAELVEQASALEIQAAPANVEPLADGLLDLDDPLI